MRIAAGIFRFIGKVLLLPVILVLTVVYALAGILVRLSGIVLSLVILFVIGCGIYSAVMQNWTDVAILLVIAAVLVGCALGASLLLMLLEMLLGRLTGVLRA